MYYYKFFWVYIMGSLTGTLYVGVTNNLKRRVIEHKTGKNDGFTKKYGCTRLLYYEEYDSVTEAIKREKQLKKLSRTKKEKLINKINPEWVDLSKDW